MQLLRRTCTQMQVLHTVIDADINADIDAAWIPELHTMSLSRRVGPRGRPKLPSLLWARGVGLAPPLAF